MKKIILALLALLLLSACRTTCEIKYDEIESQLQGANYCTSDSDCTTILLGADYIEFGCYHYINKAANTSDIFGKIAEYEIECDKMINMCTESPQPVRKYKKCVEPSQIAEVTITQGTQYSSGDLNIGVGSVHENSAVLHVYIKSLNVSERITLNVSESRTIGGYTIKNLETSVSPIPAVMPGSSGDYVKLKITSAERSIEISVDEEPMNPENHKRIRIADIVLSPSNALSLKILDDSRPSEITRLNKAFEKISAKETLTLTFEEQRDGALYMMASEINSSNENYIHAVRDAFVMEGFSAEISK